MRNAPHPSAAARGGGVSSRGHRAPCGASRGCSGRGGSGPRRPGGSRRRRRSSSAPRPRRPQGRRARRSRSRGRGRGRSAGRQAAPWLVRELRGRNHRSSWCGLLARSHRGRRVADGQQARRHSAGALSRGVRGAPTPPPQRGNPACVLMLVRGGENVQEDFVQRPAETRGDAVQLVQERRVRRRAAVAVPALVPSRALHVKELAWQHRAELPALRGVEGDRDGVHELLPELLAAAIRNEWLRHQLRRHSLLQPHPRRRGRRAEKATGLQQRPHLGGRGRRVVVLAVGEEELVRHRRRKGRPAHVDARRFQDGGAVGRGHRHGNRLSAPGS
mmetsp:Transcript_58547/g.176911  ORF Transcript_58547/g.176911 Transcript_58547/m.176911 type:complete len:331 (+) Transcript_58547:21-1013(+)